MAGIGLLGTSSTGKTTLAKEFSKVTGVPFIASQARAAFAMHNLNPEQKMDFDQRMQVQTKILDLAESDYKSVKSLFITDRTPIDFAAHAISEALAINLTEMQTAGLMDYVGRCYRLTNLHFSSIILIQPAIDIAPEHGRPTNAAYLNHLNFVMIGMLADPDNRLHCAKHFLKRSMVNLNRRVETVVKIALLSETHNMNQRSESVIH